MKITSSTTNNKEASYPYGDDVTVSIDRHNSDCLYKGSWAVKKRTGKDDKNPASMSGCK